MKKLILTILLFLLAIFIFSCDGEERIDANHTHKASSWIIEKNSTCTEKGLQVCKCTVCQEVLESEEIAKTDHVGKWQTITPANCEHKGLSEYICINCNKTLNTKSIPAHNTVYQSAIEPTCTETGLTKGSYCKDCGVVFEKQNVISATGHNYKIIPSVAPTCINVGWTEGEKCSNCFDIRISPEQISKIDHQYIELSASSPTCTEEGIERGGIKCKTCGIKQYQAIPPLGHSYDLVTGECTRCNSAEYPKYTVWDNFLSNYVKESSFILDIRNMEFNQSKDYTVTILSNHNYIRVIGDQNVIYKNVFFVINNRSSEITIDFVNVNIQNQSQVSKEAIITSLSNCDVNIGLYGNVCELSGLDGKNGKSGTISDLSISDGDDGNPAIYASAGKINIFCSAPSIKISGGDGGDGGGNPNSVADGGNGAYAIKASSVNIKFASGFTTENISISGGKGGVGGYTVVWFEAKKGAPGDDATASNVEIKYN